MQSQKEDTAKLFETHLPLAYRMAAKFSATYAVPLPEIIDEARAILGLNVAQWHAQTASGYDATKGTKPTSWIYRGLYWDLLNYCTRKRSPAKAFSTLTNGEDDIDFKGKESWVEKTLRNLGEDAKIVVTTILMAPTEIAEDISPNTRGRARKAVKGYLSSQGWSEMRVNRAWNEVAECLA